jgi:hypothetical protein
MTLRGLYVLYVKRHAIFVSGALFLSEFITAWLNCFLILRQLEGYLPFFFLQSSITLIIPPQNPIVGTVKL